MAVVQCESHEEDFNAVRSEVRGKMRIRVVLGFCAACSAFLVASEGAGPSPRSRGTVNIPFRGFINAVGSRTRKVFSLSPEGKTRELPVGLTAKADFGDDLSAEFTQAQEIFEFPPSRLVPQEHPRFFPRDQRDVGTGGGGTWASPPQGHAHSAQDSQGWGLQPPPPTGQGGWGSQAPQGYSQPEAKGWGWEEPVTSPPPTPGGWGRPVSFCENFLLNRTILRLEDLESEWRILRVTSAEGRVELNARDVFNTPIKPIPSPPLQVKSDDSANYARTFVDELSLDFDVDVRNAGFSMTRNRFSTRNDSVANEILPVREESGENVVWSTVSVLKFGRLDAPLRGRFDARGNFERGLKGARNARESGETANPIQNFFGKDLLFASELLGRLEEFEGTERLGEMPRLLSRLQKHTLPEMNHKGRTFLDMEFNFGLPASHVEEEGVGGIVEGWRELRRLEERRRRLQGTTENSGGIGDEEVDAEFVRNRLKLVRTVGLESYKQAEELAQKEVDASLTQFLICPMRGGNCSDTECPLDPGRYENQLTNGSGGSGGGNRRPRPTG